MHPSDTPQLELPRPAPVAASDAAPTPPLHTEVQLVSSIREFCALANEWARLNAEAATTGVFNTWMWHFAWWEQHRRLRALKILVARRAGTVIGIVPLYLDRSGVLGLGLRALRLLGTQGARNPYNVGPLFERGNEPAIARLLAQTLLTMRGYDVLQLADTDASIPLALTLAQAARASKLRCDLERAKRLVHLALPANWNAYLRSLSSEQRARVRHRRHALLGAHRAQFFVWHTGVDAMLNALTILRRMRTAPVDAQHPSLQRAAMCEALQDGRLRLYCLEMDGRIGAVACAMRLRDRMVVMQTEFDPRYAQWHPISVLLQYAIEHAIGEGAKGFDFLRGQEDFDDELAPGNEQVRVTVYRSAIAGAVFRARRIFVPS
jgi:CelD/BcsL family acetyltransferase involved in cellulose biosynthesis